MKRIKIIFFKDGVPHPIIIRDSLPIVFEIKPPIEFDTIIVRRSK